MLLQDGNNCTVKIFENYDFGNQTKEKEMSLTGSYMTNLKFMKHFSQCQIETLCIGVEVAI